MVVAIRMNSGGRHTHTHTPVDMVMLRGVAFNVQPAGSLLGRGPGHSRHSAPEASSLHGHCGASLQHVRHGPSGGCG